MMIRSALDQGAVDMLLLSEGLRKRRVGWRCKPCKHEWEASQNHRSEIPDCPKCGSEDVSDLHEVIEGDEEVIRISSQTGQGIDEIRSLLIESIDWQLRLNQS